MKEAYLYKKLSDKRVQCQTCSHYCVISPGKRGICGVRENHNGKLFSLVYGKAIACHIDPIEKKPLYHFLPGTLIYSIATVGCNFSCKWCQNWDISQAPKPDKPILGDNIAPKKHIEQALDYKCPSIAYTYTEPTIFLEYALDTMKLAKKAGLKNVWVTNGYMSEEALKIILPYLDAANVDFKGPDDEVYLKYCGAKAKPVMENIERIHKAGIHLEVTTLVVPGVNDKSAQLDSIAKFLAGISKDISWHVSRFFPAYQMADTPVTPLATLNMAEDIGKKAGLKYIHIGNI